MTKAEIQDFIKHENELLERSFNFDYPEYKFRWDDEGEVCILEIYDRTGTLRKTHAISHEVTKERFLIRVHQAIDLFIARYPDWQERRDIW